MQPAPSRQSSNDTSSYTAIVGAGVGDGVAVGSGVGSAVGAALAAFQGIDCYVPHGGFIVALATNNVALFCLDIVIGAVVAAAILIAMKPTLDKQAK